MEQAQVEQIFAEIATFRIELEPDPTVLGPQYINQVLAQCRNYLNRASATLLTLNKLRRELKRELSGEQTALEIEKDQLLATNEVVKRQPSVRDREAVANTMLRPRLNKIATLNGDLLDLETVEQAVKLVHSELVRTSADIKTQRSTLHTDRTTGSGYGDESSGNTPGAPLGGKADELNEAELERIMQESSTPPPEPAPVVPKSEEVPSGITTLHEEAPLSVLVLPEEESAKRELYQEAYEKQAGESTPKEPPAEPSSEPEGEDPDIARFLASSVAPPAVNPEPPAKEKSDVKVEPKNDDEFDLEDLLSKL
jgi:hypothetical protein